MAKRILLFGLALFGLCAKLFAQGGNTFSVAAQSGNLVSLPDTINQTKCDLTDDYNAVSYLYEGCLQTNYSGGPDYVYAFQPQSAGLVQIDISVLIGSETPAFGVFLYQGSIDGGGSCVTSKIGSSAKKINLLAKQGQTYYLLIDLKDTTTSCIEYSVIFTSPSLSSVPSRQDCAGATPVCKSVYVETNVPSGDGTIDAEINPAGTGNCLVNDEQNSLWYSIEIYKPGKLHFSIFPNDTADDFDFALYNVTTHTCADLDSLDTMLTVCNFSTTKDTTGLLMNTALGSSQGASGSPFCPAPTVNSGEKYILVITKKLRMVSGTPVFNDEGFTLSFDSSTAVIYESGVPKINSVYVPLGLGCNQAIMFVSFDRNVLASTVQISDFGIESSTGKNYSPVSIEPFLTESGANRARDFLMVFEPPLEKAESLDIIIRDPIMSLCGSIAWEQRFPAFMDYSDSVTVEIDSILPDGSMQICASRTSSDNTYVWSASAVPLSGTGMNTQCITINSPGRYSVTIKNNNNCRLIARPIFLNW